MITAEIALSRVVEAHLNHSIKMNLTASANRMSSVNNHTSYSMLAHDYRKKEISTYHCPKLGLSFLYLPMTITGIPIIILYFLYL